MFNLRLAVRPLFALVCVATFTLVANAQRQRTFVATFGSDASADCSEVNPCRNWQRAVDLVQSGGTVAAKDSGGFGAVVINKSVTLTGEGFYAAARAVNAAGSIAVNVTANSATVMLRHLNIENAASAPDSTGVSLTGVATTLHIESCVITGFSTGTGTGISINSVSGDSRTYIKDTVLRNHQFGITAQASPAGFLARVNIDRTRAENYFTIGYNIQAGGQMVVRDSIAAGRGPLSGAAGFFVGFQGELSMERSGANYNGNGVRIDFLGVARLTESLITNNTTGVNNSGGGTFRSFLNNRIDGNGTDVSGPITGAPQT
jgi:hypothetical protein